MDNHYDSDREKESCNHGRNITMKPQYLTKLSPWLDLKVFYVRVTNIEIDEWTPNYLTLNYIALTPDTVLEVNGKRSNIYTERVSYVLKRDRIDKRSKEATFVSTNSISMISGVRFEVYARDDRLIHGVLEFSKKKWRMKCKTMLSGNSLCLSKNKWCQSPDMALPIVEVYVAGYFSCSPIILTKTLQMSVQKKSQMKVMLDSIPEDESTGEKKEVASKDTLKLSEYYDFTPAHNEDIDYKSIYSGPEYCEDGDGELSWFNEGVRVRVGLGLGICLSVGVGIGLLIQTYRATARNLKKQLI